MKNGEDEYKSILLKPAGEAPVTSYGSGFWPSGVRFTLNVPILPIL